MPLASWRSTLTDHAQLYGRLPHPWIQSGSAVVLKTCWPKLLFAIVPHVSPPKPLAFGFRRSQSGTRLPLPSVHDRLVFVTIALCGLNVLLITHETRPT